MKSKNKKTLIKEKEKIPGIKSSVFPKYICLEHCNINHVPNGFERDVLETLKSFSNEDKFKSNKPHDLYKDNKLSNYFKKCSYHNTDKLFSLDIKGRDSKYRLLYCVDSEKIHKILHLCTDETHINK